LIVTGSPAADQFHFPDGTDYIKMPSVTKDPNGDYVSRSLSSDLETIRDMRQDILFSAARHYQPDFFIVDHTPAGLKGEAIKTLRHVKETSAQTKLIVGLRDVVDEAAVVQRSWARDGIYELLDDVYDLILVYGLRTFYDLVTEYRFSERAAEKTRFVGYLGRNPELRSRDEVRASLAMQTDKLVVVTAGGGGDGEMLYDAVLRDLHITRATDFDCLIVGGPLLSEADRARLHSQLGSQGNVQFLDFTDDLPSYLGAADAVISMGGYNAICEILSLGRPAIVVPRTKPRKEQLIRARILSMRGLIQMIHPSDLAPGRLLMETQNLLQKPTINRPFLPMEGLGNAMRAVGSLMSRPDHFSVPYAGLDQFAELRAANA
jgi:predicted glycosyltransferase